MARIKRENAFKSQGVVVYSPDYGSGGRYRIAEKSGLLTTVAAKTATAGHMAAFRWSSSSKICLVHRINVKWVTTTGFTAAQVVGFQVFLARSYTASHTGGTQLTLTTNNGKLRSDSTFGYPTTSLGDFSIGTTGALTAGTHTLDAQPFMSAGAQELADGAAVVKKSFEDTFCGRDGSGPLVLTQDTGFVVTNTVLGGTAGVWNIHVAVDWSEVDAYGQ